MAVSGALLGPRLHRLEEDVLERVAARVEAADLHALVGGDLVEVAHLDLRRQQQLEATLAVYQALDAELGDGLGEVAVAAAHLELEELAVGAALGLEVANRGDAPVL